VPPGRITIKGENFEELFLKILENRMNSYVKLFKKKAITISELIPGAIYSSNIKDKEILLKEVLCVHEKELFILTKSNIEIKEEKNKRKKEKDNIQTSNYRISGQNIKIQNKILEKDEYFDYIFM